MKANVIDAYYQALTNEAKSKADFMIKELEKKFGYNSKILSILIGRCWSIVLIPNDTEVDYAFTRN